MCGAVGIDLGYNRVKIFNGRWEKQFPSIVGTDDVVLFTGGLVEDTDIMLEEPYQVRIGEGVGVQSRWSYRRQDRDWWKGEEWRALFLAGLSEATWTSGEAVVTIGWPVSWYSDKGALRAFMLGEHKFKRSGRDRQTVNIVDARVIPQGLGMGCDYLLDAEGQAKDKRLLKKHVAYVIVGSNNSGFVDAQGLRVGKASAHRDFGSWTAIDEMREVVTRKAPGLRLSDHAVDQVLQTGVIRDSGGSVDVSAEASVIWSHLTQATKAAMSQLWGSCRQFDEIVFGGGCVHHIGRALLKAYPWGTLHPRPVLADVTGMWKLSKRVVNLRKAGK